ncbi:MAG TPA: isochorismatase family protein [Kofleriaceae bacterium]
MTSLPMRDPQADQLLTPHNCAFIFIDIQPLQVASVQSMERRELVENIVNVAKTAMIYRVPTILSTVNGVSLGGQPSIKPLLDTLKLPEIDRTQINAWEDREFVAAVKATNRKKLVFVALWTEVCLAFPVLDALREGYDCYHVIDAVGGTSVDSHLAGLRRIEQAGSHPISWTSLMCEMQRDWGRVETRDEFAKVLFTVEGH